MVAIEFLTINKTNQIQTDYAINNTNTYTIHRIYVTLNCVLHDVITKPRN